MGQQFDPPGIEASMTSFWQASGLFVLTLTAGCTDQPETNPVWCPPEPFYMDGPVTVMVGYGTVWVSNSTGVYRFQVAPDNDLTRDLCGEALP